MPTEQLAVATTIDAAPEEIFAVLADPASHADIDGTGWVREAQDSDRLTSVGQIFRMAMYHENHPDGDYEIANRVEVLDEPRAIAWKPGTEEGEDRVLSFGGWTWRYDLVASGPTRTEVTLTYDWSDVGPEPREQIQFPPFEVDHLQDSLEHLAGLVVAARTPASQMARYEALIGTWRTSGDILDERGESAGRVDGWDLYDRLGDSFIIHRVSVDMDGQQMRAVEVVGPELGVGAAATRAFGHDGSEETSTSMIEAEGVFTFGSEGARARMEIAEDGATGTADWERSDDGGTTWRPWMRLRFARQADNSLWP